MKRQWKLAAQLALLGSVGMWLTGCGGASNSTPPPPAPKIQNINSSTSPSSPVGLPIEINGSGFQAAPGKVTFIQGSITQDVVPATSAWSDTGIVAVVPAGNGTTNFTVPGTVNVTVTTSGGTSNSVALNLVAVSNFSPSNMGWGTTTALPTALTGLRAIGVPGSNGTAFAVVTGGYNGTANTTTVWSNTLAAAGTVGASWTTITTNPLPSTVAHHAMAEADSRNSLVTTGTAYVYVIGGQTKVTDTGGVSTVNMAAIDVSTASTAGSIGTWKTTTALPQALMGASATVHNGYLYVAGGLDSTGNPVNTVYSAPVNSDGTIGTWTTSTNTLLKKKAFGTMFVYGGIMYYINGDSLGGFLPNNEDVGDTDVYFASAVRGAVGSFTLNANLTIGDRSKANLFVSLGQVISGEGIYTGAPGSKEMEYTSINGSNTTNVALNTWNGLTGATYPAAKVYNAGGFTSPLYNPTSNGPMPRFLLLGGQTFVTMTTATAPGAPGGALTTTVYYNTAP